MTKGAAQKLLELQALDLRAQENTIADLEAKIQLLEQDLKKCEERRKAQQEDYDSLMDHRRRQFHALRAIAAILDTAQ